MADQEDEDLKMALRMSMQYEPPEPKRSRPGGNNPPPAVSGGGGVEETEESQEMRNRRIQRELMATAAEKRMMAAKNAASAATTAAAKKIEKSVDEERSGGGGAAVESADGSVGGNVGLVRFENERGNSGQELSAAEAQQLFSMIFGGGVSKDILAQWSNQGIR